MQRLDLAPPGEGQLVIGPVALGDDRHLVFAGAFERPVVIGGDILDHCERIVPGIDNAFEEGHTVSTLPLEKSDTSVIRTRQARHALTSRAVAGCKPLMVRSLRGSTDVICGIGATAPRVRPQAKRGSSTAHRGT